MALDKGDLYIQILDSDVIQKAKYIRDKYHSEIKGANIGFIWRREPSGRDHPTVGYCKKVSPVDYMFSGYDFIIWLARDIYYLMTDDQRSALIDHELSHAGYDYDNDKYKTVHHDIEEFHDVFQRWGFWNRDLLQWAKVIKAKTLTPYQQLELIDEDTDTDSIIAGPPKPAGKTEAIPMPAGADNSQLDPGEIDPEAENAINHTIKSARKRKAVINVAGSDTCGPVEISAMVNGHETTTISLTAKEFEDLPNKIRDMGQAEMERRKRVQKRLR